MEGFIRINASRDEAEYRSSSFRRGVGIKLLSGRSFFFFSPPQAAADQAEVSANWNISPTC